MTSARWAVAPRWVGKVAPAALAGAGRAMHAPSPAAGFSLQAPSRVYTIVFPD